MNDEDGVVIDDDHIFSGKCMNELKDKSPDAYEYLEDNHMNREQNSE